MWRTNPPPFAPAAGEIDRLVPHLVRGGLAGLVWRRLNATANPPDAAALPLRREHRALHLAAQLHRERLLDAMRRLGDAKLPAILGKGWSAARDYAAPALRPHGDIDLYVRPGSCAAARRCLDLPGPDAEAVDLHEDCPDAGAADWSELEAAAVALSLDGVPVRIFGPEHRLRLACLHLLRHGGWRPLWLCDVAAAIEARPAGFDWERAIGTGPGALWILATLRLAGELLGADLRGTPADRCREPLPRWLTAATLRAWGDLRFEPHGRRARLATLWRAPRALLSGLRARWPRPLEASLAVAAPCDATPRLPYQIAAWGLHMARGLRRAAAPR